MGFPRQNNWNGLPFLFPGYLPDAGIKLHLLHWQVDSLLLSHHGSPIHIIHNYFVFNKTSIYASAVLWTKPQTWVLYQMFYKSLLYVLEFSLGYDIVFSHHISIVLICEFLYLSLFFLILVLYRVLVKYFVEYLSNSIWNTQRDVPFLLYYSRGHMISA